jgi:flagellar biosynthesis/type III secretory pathway protein FliH
MSTKDDALISQMLFGYFDDQDPGTEVRQRMLRAALRIARKAILEEAANNFSAVVDDLVADLGECPRASVLREAEQIVRALNEAKP